MIQFELFTKENAPEGAESGLMEVEKKVGFVPNLQRVMAQAPALLDGYLSLWSLFENTSLTPAEQQVVLITTSVENGCTYCVAAHTGLARLVGLSQSNLDALRKRIPLPDAKLNALRDFTAALVEKRGWASEQDFTDFLAAGYGRQQVLEVILGIAHKLMSNFTNHVASTPLDKAFENDAWDSRERSVA
jgi:uncharacterized peroxidase-related enzyme